MNGCPLLGAATRVVQCSLQLERPGASVRRDRLLGDLESGALLGQVVQAFNGHLAKQIDYRALAIAKIGKRRLAGHDLPQERVIDVPRVDQMFVQIPVFGGGGKRNALLADEDATTNIFAPDVDRPPLVGPHQKPEHFVQRDKTQIS